MCDGGGINYSIISGNDGNYFSLTNLTDRIINAKAGTPAGTYPLTIRATNTSSGATKDGVLTITINVKEASISFDSSQMAKMIGADPFTNTLTNTGDATVTYSSSDSSVASVNSSGLVTISSCPGTCASIRIYATVSDTANCTYAVKSIYYTLTITKLPTSDGHFIIKLNDAWKVSGAKTAVHLWGASGDYYSEILDNGNYLSTDDSYLVPIPDGSWSHAQTLRINPSCGIDEEGYNFNPYEGYIWNWSSNIDFNNNYNWYEMNAWGEYGDDKDKMTWKNQSSKPCVVGGESVYLDLNGYGWTADNAVIGAMLENGMGSSSSLKLEMKKVEGFDVGGSGEGHLYEVKVPSNEAFRSFKFFRAQTLDGAWWNSTGSETQYYVLCYKNVFKLTAYENKGSFDWNMDDVSRAVCFGTYFLNSTGCDRYGINRPTIDWDEAKAQFNNMSNNAEALFTNCDPLVGGTTYEQAAARYDYIVRKYGTSEYENFADRTISSKSRSSGLFFGGFNELFGEENSINTLIIIVSSSVSIIAITSLTILLVRKKARK